ncbi:MAG: hypothetical protein ACK4SY_01285 [Pyrobaculum sp.]
MWQRFMLSDYILYKIQTLQERTYNKLVLILASTSMAGVMASGLALIFVPPLKYVALTIIIAGIVIARKTLQKTELKIRKLLAAPEREIEVSKYLAAMKELYIPDYLTPLSTSPKIEDPLVRSEKKPLEASRHLLKTRVMTLKTRAKIVTTASIMAVVMPHLLIEKDLFLALVGIILVLKKI